METDSNKMKPQLIIPMTGISSRFSAAGYNLPKFLLNVNGQAVIDHVLDMFPDWEDVIFCCNEIHLDSQTLGLEDHLLERRPNARIVRVSNNTKGPGWAVIQAKHLVDLERPVVVNYCDFTCYWDSDDLENNLISGEYEGCIPAYTGFHPHMAHSTSYAYLKMEDSKVVDIREKQPWTEDPNSEFASSGTYGFASGALLFDSLESQINQNISLNGEFYLSLTYKPLLANGGRVSTLAIQHFMQWGTPQDFEEYQDYSNALKSWTSKRAGQTGTVAKMSKVILASGAGSRFYAAGYSVPKPALQLSGKSLLEHSSSSIPGDECNVVTRIDLNDRQVISDFTAKMKYKVVTLNELSRGQAESALIGIKSLKTNNPVTVTSCDAISVISSESVASAFSEVGEEGLVAWVSNPYHAAKRNPKQYGWVAKDSKNHATKSWIKVEPDEQNAGVLIGTFGFSSRDYAIYLIEELVKSGKQVNGEFYLDSLIDMQIHNKKPCLILEVPSFVSVGTPIEYESVLYWQSCFDKWPLHPYKLINDPMVDQNDISRISKEFRVFESKI